MIAVDEMFNEGLYMEAVSTITVSWNCPNCNHYHEEDYYHDDEFKTCKNCESKVKLVNYN